MGSRTDRAGIHGLDATHILLLVGVTALAVYDLVYLVVWVTNRSEPPFGDFFGLWSYGRFARSEAGAVYDLKSLSAFQRSLDPLFSGGYAFPYPPPFLLALVPIGYAPLAAGFVGWLIATFCFYIAATLGRQWRSLAGVTLLVAPTTLLTIIAGQNGFLTAALLVGGLQSLKRRPLLAGVMFGLLAYKPQFGLVVPVVLLATRSWRPIMTAAATGCAAILATTLVFGAAIWSDWFYSLSMFGRLLTIHLRELYHVMPTFMANLLGLGAPMAIAAGCEIVAAVIVLAVTWRETARAWDERSMALVLLGTLIVTPYAFTYDLPILTAAVVLEVRRRQRVSESIGVLDAIAVSLAWGVPLYMTGHTIPFVEPVLIAFLFVRTALHPTPTSAWQAWSGRWPRDGLHE